MGSRATLRARSFFVGLSVSACGEPGTASIDPATSDSTLGPAAPDQTVASDRGDAGGGASSSDTSQGEDDIDAKTPASSDADGSTAAGSSTSPDGATDTGGVASADPFPIFEEVVLDTVNE